MIWGQLCQDETETEVGMGKKESSLECSQDLLPSTKGSTLKSLPWAEAKEAMVTGKKGRERKGRDGAFPLQTGDGKGKERDI